MNCENAIERKTREEIKKLQIDNERAKGNLIEKKIVRSMLKDIARVARGSFIDLPKTHAPKIAKILDAPEREGEIKKLLADMIEEATNKIAQEIKDEAGPSMASFGSEG